MKTRISWQGLNCTTFREGQRDCLTMEYYNLSPRFFLLTLCSPCLCGGR